MNLTTLKTMDKLMLSFENLENLNSEIKHKKIEKIYSTLSSQPPLSDICEKINQKQGKICPKCGTSNYVLNGKDKGIQKYKCKHCGKYFNEFSSTAVAYMKKRDKLKPFIDGMLSGDSLKRCAENLGLSTDTTHAWRIKVIAAHAEHVPKEYSGIVEIIEYICPFSQKGQGAKAKKIGQKGTLTPNNQISRSDPPEPVSVIIVQDREKKLELKVIKQGTLTETDLKVHFSLKFKKVKKLCTNQNKAIKQFAIDKKVSYHIKDTEKKIKGRNKYYHTEQTRKTIFNLLLWMDRFKGVSSKYLQNYLYWYMMMEQLKGEYDFPFQFLAESIRVRDGRKRYEKCTLFGKP